MGVNARIFSGSFEKIHNKVLKKYLEKIDVEEVINLTLKHELDNRNIDYLRVTKSLHIRSVCEEFEATNPILGDKNNKESRKKNGSKCSSLTTSKVQISKNA
jgi:hypothetical protein